MNELKIIINIDKEGFDWHMEYEDQKVELRDFLTINFILDDIKQSIVEDIKSLVGK